MHSNGKAKSHIPRRLAHVNLWVESLERSEKFYRQTCGLMVEFTEPELLATFMGVGHTQHDLGMMKTTEGVDRLGRDGKVQIPGTVGKTPGLNHIAWELDSEAALIRAYRNMQQRGVRYDAAMDHQIAHSIYLFDPDGNYNEMYCDTLTDWRSVLHGEMGLITSRWNPETAEATAEPRFPVNTVARTSPDAALHPKRITHLILQTPDLIPMVSFYTGIVGLEVAYNDDRSVFLRGSLNSYPAALALLKGSTPNYLRVAFELESESEFYRSLEELKVRGVRPVRDLSLPWKRSIILCDPDGLESEWYVPRQAPQELHGLTGADFTYSV